MLSPLTEGSYALLRLLTGLFFSFHGLQKVFGVLSNFQPEAGSQLWIGGVIELVCGALIAVGFFTRFSAFLSSGTMAVAYAQFHWKFEGGAQLIPAVNKGELAAVYALVFLYLACRGGGAFSVDKARGAA
jgi:putative oxidoreductase